MASCFHRVPPGDGVFRRSIRYQVLYEPVLVVDSDHTRFDLLVGKAERDDDHLVAGMKMSGRGAVDDDLAGTAGQTDGIGFDPLAVVDVPEGDLLAGNDIGAVQKLLRSEEHTSELQSPCNIVC